MAKSCNDMAAAAHMKSASMHMKAGKQAEDMKDHDKAAEHYGRAARSHEEASRMKNGGGYGFSIPSPAMASTPKKKETPTKGAGRRLAKKMGI